MAYACTRVCGCFLLLFAAGTADKDSGAEQRVRGESMSSGDA
jgi:hypothetical protein